MRSFSLFIFVMVLAANVNLMSPSAQPAKLQLYSGMCEASGAVAAPKGSFAGWFIVANDEDNVLRAYNAERAGAAPRAVLDLDDHLGIPQQDRGKGRGKADIEAATWLGDHIYWIGSHSRNSDGQRRRSRHQFFATSVTTGEAGIQLQPTGRAVSLLDELRDALDASGLGLGWTVGQESDDKQLAPEREGLNVEGLAARPDGGSMLIGLRNPLADGRAVLIPFLNPHEAVNEDAKPKLGGPMTLDLGGRGIRSMDYSVARRAYVIVAGPRADGAALQQPAFELYTWSGDPVAAAQRLPGVAEAVADPITVRTETLAGRSNFHPEAAILNRDGTAVWLLSDDGDLQLNGAGCSNLGESQRQFRGIILPLP
ncbi:DUF3616 domain-containing protein [Belnapia sp. T18]|uniref:DUF3616 domain-containing protein n=1 Tax=Belnapia arida TaxID=2804533 RepID=A0ABS1U7G2_9PROT|nr:DUF3616 domain-containing protein [Belnapia arida]MBL6080095.1 DUF3616 domain-containing protein [Belnapia arida]